jgi:hypothetical protein
MHQDIVDNFLILGHVRRSFQKAKDLWWNQLARAPG